MPKSQELKVTFILKKDRNQSDCGLEKCVIFDLITLHPQMVPGAGLILYPALAIRVQNHGHV